MFHYPLCTRAYPNAFFATIFWNSPRANENDRLPRLGPDFDSAADGPRAVCRSSAQFDFDVHDVFLRQRVDIVLRNMLGGREYLRLLLR